MEIPGSVYFELAFAASRVSEKTASIVATLGFVTYNLSPTLVEGPYRRVKLFYGHRHLD